MQPCIVPSSCAASDVESGIAEESRLDHVWFASITHVLNCSKSVRVNDLVICTSSMDELMNIHQWECRTSHSSN
jgi:hypothetical protein